MKNTTMMRKFRYGSLAACFQVASLGACMSFQALPCSASEELHQEAIPRDLEQLVDLWDLETNQSPTQTASESDESGEGSQIDDEESREEDRVRSYRKLSHIASENSDLNKSPKEFARTEFDLAQSTMESGNRFNFSAQTLTENARKTIISDLFGNKSEIPKFCHSFAIPSYTPKNADLLELNELEALREKKRASICKKKTSDLLGGVFHANTLVQYQSFGNQEHARAAFYIQSLLDESKFLRYEFVIR